MKETVKKGRTCGSSFIKDLCGAWHLGTPPLPADKHRPDALAEGPAPPTAALPGVPGPFPGGPAQQSAPRHTYISLIFSPRPKTKEGTFPIIFPELYFMQIIRVLLLGI